MYGCVIAMKGRDVLAMGIAHWCVSNGRYPLKLRNGFVFILTIRYNPMGGNHW